MAVNKTSLSAGEIIRTILLKDQDVSTRANKIFPVVTGTAELPYIVYRRIEMEVSPTKAGYPGADTLQFEVLCHTSNYGDGVELAEAVRSALDNVRAEHDGMTMRGCYLSGGEEGFENDAFIQQLIFNVKI